MNPSSDGFGAPNMNVGWGQLRRLRVMGLLLFGDLPRRIRDGIESLRILIREASGGHDAVKTRDAKTKDKRSKDQSSE